MYSVIMAIQIAPVIYFALKIELTNPWNNAAADSEGYCLTYSCIILCCRTENPSMNFKLILLPSLCHWELKHWERRQTTSWKSPSRNILLHFLYSSSCQTWTETWAQGSRVLSMHTKAVVTTRAKFSVETHCWTWIPSDICKWHDFTTTGFLQSTKQKQKGKTKSQNAAFFSY